MDDLDFSRVLAALKIAMQEWKEWVDDDCGCHPLETSDPGAWDACNSILKMYEPDNPMVVETAHIAMVKEIESNSARDIETMAED